MEAPVQFSTVNNLIGHVLPTVYFAKKKKKKSGRPSFSCFLAEKILKTSLCVFYFALQGVQSQDRHLFLFNDLLLIAKARSGGNFKLKEKVRISEIWLTKTCLEDVSELNRSEDTSFVMGWPTTNVVVTFRYFFFLPIFGFDSRRGVF
jgi:hypothetical protein